MNRMRLKFFASSSLLCLLVVSFISSRTASKMCVSAFVSQTTTTTVSKRTIPRMVVSSLDLPQRQSSNNQKGNNKHNHGDDNYNEYSDHPRTRAPTSSISNRSMSSTTGGSIPSSPSMVLDPLVVCGPSGVGKGTIIQQFMDNYASNNNSNSQRSFGFSVSHTTRQPRPGEQDGVHYHFVPSVAEMQDLIGQGAFVEWAEVHGNYYGTSWATLQTLAQNQQTCLLDIDVQGVRRLKELHAAEETQQQHGSASSSFQFQPKYIFIAPPSLDSLAERLTNRATETPESLERRLANAAAEVEYGLAPGNFDAVIVNDDLEEAVRAFADKVQALYATT